MASSIVWATKLSVMSTTRFPEAVLNQSVIAEGSSFSECKTSPKLSPNCVPKRLRSFFIAPLYSIDYINTPRFMTRLLTDRL
jgi:hypothetical protein